MTLRDAILLGGGQSVWVTRPCSRDRWRLGITAGKCQENGLGRDGEHVIIAKRCGGCWLRRQARIATPDILAEDWYLTEVPE